MPRLVCFRHQPIPHLSDRPGHLLGQRLRGVPVDMLGIQVCLLVASHSILGAVLGSLGFLLWRVRVLWVPASIIGMVGPGYAIHRHRLMLSTR